MGARLEEAEAYYYCTLCCLVFMLWSLTCEPYSSYCGGEDQWSTYTMQDGWDWRDLCPKHSHWWIILGPPGKDSTHFQVSGVSACLKKGWVAIMPSTMECIVLHNAAGNSIPISSSLNHYFLAKMFSLDTCLWEPGMEDLWIFLNPK